MKNGRPGTDFPRTDSDNVNKGLPEPSQSHKQALPAFRVVDSAFFL
jgi:hypothetical protein